MKADEKSAVSPSAEPKMAAPVAATASQTKTSSLESFMSMDLKDEVMGKIMAEDAPTALREAVEKVKRGGDDADFVVVGWRNGVENGKGEQLELKEVSIICHHTPR